MPTPQDIREVATARYPDNNSGQIRPVDLRFGFQVIADVLDDVLEDIPGGVAFFQQPSLAQLAASMNPMAVGALVVTAREGYAYEVVSVGDPDRDLLTAGNVGLKALPNNGVLDPRAFGARGDGTGDDSAFISRALARANALGGGVVRIVGRYRITNTVVLQSNVVLDMRGGEIFTNFVPVVTGSITVGAETYTYGGHVMLRGLGISNFEIVGGVLNDSQQTSWLAGVRAIGLWGCSNYRIRDNRFIVNGGAIASVGCRLYWILNNLVTVSSTDGSPHHDGIIDQWWGSSNFVVAGNKVFGSGYGRYGILVTGTTTAPSPAGCFNFTIRDNYVERCTATGIWVMGRTGLCANWSVQSNVCVLIENYAFRFSDADGGDVTGNTAVQPSYGGFWFGSEPTAGGSFGVRATSVQGNAAKQVNRAGSTDIAQGCGFYIGGEGTTLIFGANIVTETGHLRPYYATAQPTRVVVQEGLYPAGTLGPGQSLAPA